MTIRHIDVAGDLAAEPPVVGDEFLVLWYGDWPVGQLRGRDAAGPAARLRDRVPDDVHARAAAGAALERAGRPPDGRKVSVVICTRDRAEDLSRCLASLPGQSRVPDQVVVVDNASRDDGRTRAVALAAGVDYVREDRPGLDIARNRGVRTAIGDIVAFTDDDVRLHPRWLERMTAAFDSGPRPGGHRPRAARRTRDGGAAPLRDVLGFRPRLPADRLRRGVLSHGPHPWLPGLGDRRRGQHGLPAGDVPARRPVRRAARRGRGRVLGQLRVLAPSAFPRWNLPLRARGCRLPLPPAGLRRSVPADHGLHARARGGPAGAVRAQRQPGEPATRHGDRACLVCATLAAATLRGRAERDVLLAEETRGFVSGLLFYLRTPRPYHASLDQEP